ncbi:helix-turn-helix transcriptional regulator [Pontibacter mangrovi]|uniref:Helix-turn-helix transcriptional regulator n=2 Tax=Hymenobacteraceae TaxID=1853232 RepID=A0A501VPZ5_9BACT|nr:helix-turn-helix transcriptional regulator [Pontibacter mangrovi]
MVGEIIRNQRLQKGYSQEYMAYYLKISQNAYSKIERGDTEVTVRRVYEIANVLNVSIYELLPQPVASSGINLYGLPELWLRLKVSLYALLKGRFR